LASQIPVSKAITNMVNACCEAWNRFGDEEGNIQNIGHRTWARI
jgi:hypothetical protein